MTDENWMQIHLTCNPGIVTLKRGLYEYRVHFEEYGSIEIHTYRKMVVESFNEGTVKLIPTNVYFNKEEDDE